MLKMVCDECGEIMCCARMFGGELNEGSVIWAVFM